MKRKVVQKSDIKEKSTAQKIPFPNLLAGHILEELMYLIAESGFGETLWLKNGDIFGIERYRKKPQLTLEFAYITDPKVIKKGTPQAGQKLSLKMGYIMLASILKKEKIPEIKWMGKATYENGKVEMDITGELEEMVVPVHLCITEYEDEEMIPVTKKIIPFMREKHVISYVEYPVEHQLTELLFLVLNQMELITEMDVYYRIYQILGKEPIDGRHVKEILEQLCKENGMTVGQERLETILGYKEYPYMRKRFEKTMRHKKKKEPDWASVMERLEAFLPRVWNSICQDSIFFGDWMPDLGRFLD